MFILFTQRIFTYYVYDIDFIFSVETKKNQHHFTTIIIPAAMLLGIYLLYYDNGSFSAAHSLLSVCKVGAHTNWSRFPWFVCGLKTKTTRTAVNKLAFRPYYHYYRACQLHYRFAFGFDWFYNVENRFSIQFTACRNQIDILWLFLRTIYV